MNTKRPPDHYGRVLGTYNFKAGDHDQSAGSNSTVGARVEFYALNVAHS